MKKSISTNICGMLFNIEEDAYQKLNQYLNEINRYFSTYEDSREIIEDIEGRIAEIFWDRLGKDRKVLELTDVEELMVIMGSVEDFQNAEEDPAFQTTFEEEDSLFDLPTEDDFNGGNTAVQVLSSGRSGYQERVFEEEGSQDKNQEKSEPEFEPIYAMAEPAEAKKEPVRKLFRDSQRRVVGGVAAGLAHYLSIDAVWIRLLFIGLLSGLLFIPAAPATAILLYIIFWAVVPGSEHLEDNPRIRKLFRDPERKVVGGVASGLATYIGVNELYVRLAFIAIMGLYGTGMIIYSILWLIIPVAKTLTDRMQMHGETINLNNIRENLMSNLKGNEPQIGTFHRAVIFPFHVIYLTMQRIANFLRPLVSFIAEAIRIVGGLSLLFTALALTASLVASLFVLLGWGPEYMLHIDDLPVEIIMNSFDVSPWMIANAYVSIFIPTFFLGLFGVMMLNKRIIWNNKFGWSIAGLWFISLIGTGVSFGMFFQDFRAKAQVEDQRVFALDKGVLTLGVENNKDNYSFQSPRLIIRGYDDADILLEQNLVASGRNSEDARQNAQMLEYEVNQNGNKITFDRYTSFTDGAKFRRQEMDLLLYLPYNKTFKMEAEMRHVLYNTIYKNGYTIGDVKADNQWKFTPDGLICITCEEEVAQAPESPMGSGETMSFDDFREIEVSSVVHLKVNIGKKYSVKVHGDADLLNIEQHHRTLSIQMGRGRNIRQTPVVEVTLPYLEELHLSGASQASVKGLDQEDFSLDLNGASQVILTGRVESLDVNLNGASQLNSLDLKLEKANLDINGASKANINADKSKIQADLHGASSLEYKGNPRSLSTETSGFSSVTRR